MYYNVQESSVLYNNTFRQNICWHFTCDKHLRDRIISLRRKVLTHKTNIIPPLFIEAKEFMGVAWGQILPRQGVSGGKHPPTTKPTTF